MQLTMGLALAVLGLILAEGEIPEESGVLALTSETLPRALERHARLLVDFYAPWCGHCQELEPEYAEAAAQLLAEKYDVRLAKIDVTVYKDVGERYNISRFPAIKLLSAADERPIDYKGRRTTRSIVAWLRRNVGPLVPTLTDASSLRVLKRNRLAVVGFFKDVEKPAAKAFLATAEALDDVTFAITSDENLFAENGIAGPQGVVLFKQFDEERSDFAGDYTTEALSAFVRQQSVPLVTEFTLDDGQEIFDKSVKTRVLMFVGKSSAGYQSAVQSASKVASRYRGKIRFVVLDTDNEESGMIVALFSLKKEQLPAYRLVVFEGKEMTRFKPETEEMSEELMASFLARYEAGQLQPDRLSQALPGDWDERPVKVLVGSNYNGVTRGSGKKVIVKLYSPMCEHSKNLAPVWEQLGDKYKDAADLIVAEFDATANEAEGLEIKGYPSIKLYLPGVEKEIDYSGTRTIAGLSLFVDSDGKQQMPKRAAGASSVVEANGIPPRATDDKSSDHGEL